VEEPEPEPEPEPDGALVVAPLLEDDACVVVPLTAPEVLEEGAVVATTVLAALEAVPSLTVELRQVALVPFRMVKASEKTVFPVESFSAAVREVPAARSTSQVYAVPVCWGKDLTAAAEGWPPGIRDRKYGGVPSDVHVN